MRARRSSDRIGLGASRRPIRCATNAASSRRGQVGDASSADARARRWRRGTRTRVERASRARRLGSSTESSSHAERAELVEHGVGPDGDRSPVRDRLDHRVAESLPGRREHDEIGGGVRVGDRRGPPDGDRDRCVARRVRVEHGVVAVLRGPGDPEAHGPRHRAASRAPRRTRSRRARSCAGSRASAGGGRGRRRSNPNASTRGVAIAASADRGRTCCGS